jgi:magnesium-transporting ATPase (P-type)
MSLAANANTDSDSAAWHAVSAAEVVKRLATNGEKGLDAAEASTRLQKYGPNRLPEGKKRGPFMRFLAQFNNILVYVLLGAGFTKLMLNLWVDAGIIFGVVVLNALLGFIQEGKAEKALDSIRNMLSAEARTVRGGETRMIPAEQLVPVTLESGDKIPADLRLVDAKNLRTEEAALTGESVPADKGTNVMPANATVGDRENMAFSGTMVVSGRATGIVVATGSETELGRINQLLASVSSLETPLLRQIKTFGYAVTVAIGVISVLIFAYGKWVKGMDFVELFQAVVGIAVSLIPEGLPALITITLAIGVQRMAQRNAIIRRLPAVETLGSVSRICSDKTGTLTLMEVMVVSAVTAESAYQITGDGYAPEGEVRKDGKPAGKDPVLALMGRVSVLCNDAELFQQERAWKVEGDPTEGALYPFASKLGMDRATEQAASPRTDAIPFESEHKFMATLHKPAAGKEALLVKGAPEVILEHCDRQQSATVRNASDERMTSFSTSTTTKNSRPPASSQGQTQSHAPSVRQPRRSQSRAPKAAFQCGQIPAFPSLVLSPGDRAASPATRKTVPTTTQ